jgi:predicted nucleic acid-binding protein
VMAVLLDSGFLLASLNSSEAEHQATIRVLESIREPIVSAGAGNHRGCLLLVRDIGNDAAAEFISSLADTELILEAPLAEDYLRSAEILRQYADANLDFVDALIAATAERLNIKRLLTLDRRDFQLIRPRHCDSFELLP